ncbi:MAG: phosphoenolpyruvate carboxylase, partial [Gaiellaceae bacterium]
MSAASVDRQAPLRADIRLLGGLLGYVLVEQEGQWLLDEVEQVRSLARARREGEDAPLAEEIHALPLERQALVLRAFGLYFQLANIAEQHHRLRRLRGYRREGQVPRESLAA